jgi:hypothetical protein
MSTSSSSAAGTQSVQTLKEADEDSDDEFFNRAAESFSSRGSLATMVRKATAEESSRGLEAVYARSRASQLGSEFARAREAVAITEELRASNPFQEAGHVSSELADSAHLELAEEVDIDAMLQSRGPMSTTAAAPPAAVAGVTEAPQSSATERVKAYVPMTAADAVVLDRDRMDMGFGLSDADLERRQRAAEARALHRRAVSKMGKQAAGDAAAGQARAWPTSVSAAAAGAASDAGPGPEYDTPHNSGGSDSK